MKYIIFKTKKLFKIKENYLFYLVSFEAGCAAGAQSVIVNTTGYGFNPIFPFFRYNIEAKRGAEFRH